MLELCPDAYLLSYSNPMAMLPWAVYEGTAFSRVFGLCHSVRDTQAFLTSLVGADPERVRFLTAGFNHQAFVLRFEQDGKSLYPRLAEVVESSPELRRRVRVEIFRRFGYFPTESSEHSAEYVPWFMGHDDQIERFRIFVGDYLERSEENLRELESLERQLASDEPLDLEPANELASLFIHSLETGDRARAARQHPQRRADLQPAGRVLRGGALPGWRGWRQAGAHRPAATAAHRAEPDVPQRGGADRAGGARRVPRPRLPGGAARPEHRRHADHRPGRRDVRRALRGPPRSCSPRPCFRPPSRDDLEGTRGAGSRCPPADYRPDASPGKLFPAAALGLVYYGYPEERWVDFRQLDALKPMLQARIAMCASKGFDAVELDDIDGVRSRSTVPEGTGVHHFLQFGVLAVLRLHGGEVRRGPGRRHLRQLPGLGRWTRG